MGWNRYHSWGGDMVAEMLFCDYCFDDYTRRPCKKCGECCQIADMVCHDEDPGWDDFLCKACDSIKPVPKIVITDKVVIIRRTKKPSPWKLYYNVVLYELTSKWELVVKQAGMTKKRNKIHKCKDPNATVMDIYQLCNYGGLIGSILFKYKPSYDRQLMNYISQNYQAGACGKYQNQTIFDYMLINANLFKRLKGEPYIYKSPTSLYELLSATHQRFYNHMIGWEDWWRWNIKSQREKEVAYSVIIQKNLPLDLYPLIIMYL
jgi:hypothetical protein